MNDELPPDTKSPFSDSWEQEKAGIQSGPAILSLDNVELDLPLAGLGTRSLALVLDVLVLAVLFIIWTLAMSNLGRFFWGLPEAWAIGISFFGYFLLQWGYFAGCEILLDGQTPGKMALSLQTVSHLGGRPSAGALLIRNLLRPVDYVFGVFFMALDRRSRRLGDMVASTLVAHRGVDDPNRALERVTHMPPSWTAKEVALVESFIARSHRMELETAEQLASDLLQWIVRTQPEFVAEREQGIDPDGYPNELYRLWSLLAVREVVEGKESSSKSPEDSQDDHRAETEKATEAGAEI